MGERGCCQSEEGYRKVHHGTQCNCWSWVRSSHPSVCIIWWDLEKMKQDSEQQCLSCLTHLPLCGKPCLLNESCDVQMCLWNTFICSCNINVWSMLELQLPEVQNKINAKVQIVCCMQCGALYPTLTVVFLLARWLSYCFSSTPFMLSKNKLETAFLKQQRHLLWSCVMSQWLYPGLIHPMFEGLDTDCFAECRLQAANTGC